MSITRILGRWALAALAVGLSLAAFAEPVKKTRTISGVDLATAGISGIADGGTLTLSGVCAGVDCAGKVRAAYLFWHGIERGGLDGEYDNAAITFAGKEIEGTVIGDGPTNCWGPGSSRAFRADVTALITGDGDYEIAGLKAEPTHSPNGASLIVLFDDGIAGNNRDVVFFEGNDSNQPEGFPGEDSGWHADLPEIEYVEGLVRVQLHVADGQATADSSLVFASPDGIVEVEDTESLYDGRSVPTEGTGRATDGELWDIHDFDISGAFLFPGTYNLEIDGQVTNEDCLALVALIVDLSAGAAPSRFDVPPTPECGSTLTVRVGETLSYDVQASDTDPGVDVILDAEGVPSGASLTPPLPATGNPVLTTFSWSPDEADIGTYAITYSARVDDGPADLCVINIEVDDELFVDLASFDTVPEDRRVALEWTTALEIDNQGFWVWRRDVVTGSEQRVSAFLPALAENNAGATYRFVDDRAVNGVEYTYFLEDVDRFGVSTRHAGAAVVANPLDPAIRVLSPVYGARLSGMSMVELRYESNTGGRHVATFSTDPTFSDPTRAWAVSSRRGGALRLGKDDLETLGRMSASSGGTLYWRVLSELSGETSATMRIAVDPLYGGAVASSGGFEEGGVTTGRRGFAPRRR